MKVSKKRFNFQHGKFTAAQPNNDIKRCAMCNGIAYYCSKCVEFAENRAKEDGMAQGKEAVLNSFESWFKGAQMLPNYDVCKNGLGLVALIRRGDYSIHTLGGKEAKK
jgi:hypothetical protein